MPLLTQHSATPYRNDSLNRIYDMLFCERLDDYRTDQSTVDYPWNVLFSQVPSSEDLEAVAADEALAARQRLLAFRQMAAHDHFVAQKELLGVIVEVALPEGLDVLAAFSDGTARYLNYAETMLVWETHTPVSAQLISALFAHSQNVVSRIGRWEGPRRPVPTNGQVRLNFLVADGLYFGEGPFNALYADAIGRPVIDAAVQLMDYLTQMSRPVQP